MNKRDISEIKEVIEHILEYRNKEIFENENIRTNTYDFEEKDKLNKITTDKYDKPLIKLNNLLKQEERYKEILEIEKHMIKIQSKKNISVKEFTEIYNVSKTAQQNYRGRHNNPLPYHQKVEGGKIIYNVEEVERWFENQHK
ncbi:hypothetical protein [Sulfurimonas sp. NWX367]|uniref:hypothetical protein n=1 Tax=unclassified Sulfurimonas TaxID=2623549 RepID=UPI00320471CA